MILRFALALFFISEEMWQMFLVLVMSMLGIAINDEYREEQICKEIFDKTKIVKDKARELYQILLAKGKFTIETTYEWAMESDSLRVAIMKWLSLALARNIPDNWSDQELMPDYELFNENTNKTLKEWCKQQFPHDLELQNRNAVNLCYERGRTYNHLYHLYKLVVINFKMPHEPKPNLVQQVAAAMDAIVPDTTPTKNTPSKDPSNGK
jgi:hypothetical protein